MPVRLRAALLAAIALLACSSGSSAHDPTPPGTPPPAPPTPACELTGCDAGRYCDATTHLCRAGCGTTADCAIAGQACESDHVCRCPTDQHVCGGSCVSSFAVATCGTRCTPCPEPTSGGHATCGGWLATVPACGIACDAQGAKVCGGACLTCAGASEWSCGATAGTCVATSCQVGYRLVGTSCVAWSRTAAVTDAYPTVSLSGGPATAIAIAPSGLPQIAWNNYAQGVWASTLGEAGWTATAVGGRYAGRPLLAIDTGGTSHVVYSETIYPPGGDGHTDLVYARGGAAGFVPETIAGSISAAASGWVLAYALALDASGAPHVAYWDGASGKLRHAVRGTDAWTVEDVPGAGASSEVGVAVDPAGKVHVVYRDDATTSLRYVARTDAGWGAAEIVDAVGGSGYDAPNGVAAAVSLAAGADGQPRVAYLDAGSGVGTSMTTWFARRGTTGTWTRARVYGAGTTYDAFAPALALDSRGGAHLANTDGGGSILYHDPSSATEWRTSVLKLYGNVAGNVSLALDAQDQPHVAWEQYIETESIWYAHEPAAGGAAPRPLGLSRPGSPR